MLVALAASLAVGGCRQAENPAPAKSASISTQPPPGQYHLDHAQPRLATTRIWIGTHAMDPEVCTGVTEVSTGLMFRPGIGPNEGMLFVFARPHQAAFYMKNVGFDIAAAYIDAEGVIQEIVKLQARNTNSVMAKSDNIQYVLETAPDWFG